jgi:biopolymer transport protein ExbD
MSALLLKKSALCWPVMLAALFLAPNHLPQEASPKPIIVQIDKTAGGIAYKVDSKVIGSEATNDLLHALNQVVDQHGVNHPVFVFVDPRLPIDEIWNVNGVAGKAQLTNVRFFIFFRENRKMTEIKWTPFVPFTPAD